MFRKEESDFDLQTLSIFNTNNEICQVAKCYSRVLSVFVCRKRYNEEYKLTAYNEILINERLHFSGLVKYFGYYVNNEDKSINLLFESTSNYCKG